VLVEIGYWGCLESTVATVIFPFLHAWFLHRLRQRNNARHRAAPDSRTTPSGETDRASTNWRTTSGCVSRFRCVMATSSFSPACELRRGNSIRVRRKSRRTETATRLEDDTPEAPCVPGNHCCHLDQGRSGSRHLEGTTTELRLWPQWRRTDAVTTRAASM
jgi:hypothetical protein